MQKVRLVLPVSTHVASYLSYLCYLEREGRLSTESLDSALEMTPKELIHLLRSHAKGENLREGEVPVVYYWLMHNDEVVGQSNLRLKLNDAFRRDGGHIGYHIKPSRRGQGYGKKILELTLKKAKTHNLKNVLLTVNEDNPASIKVIEANGGKLVDTVTNKNGNPLLHYRIEL